MSILDDVQKVATNFVPENVEDTSQEITLFKLALGAATGLSLIIGAFLILGGSFQVVMEEFAGFIVSNATIMILLGASIVYFTLTRIGVKNQEDSKKNTQ
jgi:hypothetical protein